MKNKRKKSLKGMTLIEVIISLVVFAMLGVILITVSITINNYIKATNNINSKVTREAPIAEVQNVDPDLSTSAGNVTITVKMNGATQTLNGEKFETDEFVYDPSDPTIKIKTDDPSAPGGKLNIDFIKVDPAS